MDGGMNVLYASKKTLNCDNFFSVEIPSLKFSQSIENENLSYDYPEANPYVEDIKTLNDEICIPPFSSLSENMEDDYSAHLEKRKSFFFQNFIKSIPENHIIKKPNVNNNVLIHNIIESEKMVNIKSNYQQTRSIHFLNAKTMNDEISFRLPFNPDKIISGKKELLASCIAFGIGHVSFIDQDVSNISSLMGTVGLSCKLGNDWFSIITRSTKDTSYLLENKNLFNDEKDFKKLEKMRILFNPSLEMNNITFDYLDTLTSLQRSFPSNFIAINSASSIDDSTLLVELGSNFYQKQLSKVEKNSLSLVLPIGSFSVIEPTKDGGVHPFTYPISIKISYVNNRSPFDYQKDHQRLIADINNLLFLGSTFEYIKNYSLCPIYMKLHSYI